MFQQKYFKQLEEKERKGKEREEKKRKEKERQEKEFTFSLLFPIHVIKICQTPARSAKIRQDLARSGKILTMFEISNQKFLL